jgi:methionine synthase II (cobalamin-independent)
MFATLLGALPRPPLEAGAPVLALVEAAVRAQEAAGLDPVTDGGLQPDARPVDAWEATVGLTDRAVKAAIAGPYSLGRTAGGTSRARAAATLARADEINMTLRELASAGCPLIEIHEPSATEIGEDPSERALFRDAHHRLTDGVAGTHLSLAITGGNADTAGIETLLAGPYASLAVDLISGPDNWRLVVATPGELGIVCGALPTGAGTDDGPELLLWAIAYAASTGGRGSSRVGLATAGSLAALPWDAAVRKLQRLGEAFRLAGLPLDERLQQLDPRGVSSRSAALGRVDPRPPPAPNPPDEAT